ncbi:MAG: gliding motility lipoprotein GldB [Bacteroidetes bacterium]|nr:gliding motility lipoprotein GldB [Bacteroidota bacterium]
MAFYFRAAKQIYLIFLTTALLAACRPSKNVDVSNIDVNETIKRFDHDMNAMETRPIAPQAAYMQKKYGAFYNDFMQRIIQLGSTRDTGYFKTLREIFAAGPYNDVKRSVDSVFPNLDKQNAQLTDAFKHIKYYYPKKPLPRVFAYFSGFQGAQTTIGNGYIGVGLDLFLGANSKFYTARAIAEVFPHYISRRFTPDYIVPRIVEVMAREDMFPEGDQDKTMLSKMVYNGKILYYMDRIMPEVPDTVKIGYTGKQLKWCQDFKADIWGYFLEQNLLYETDYEKMQKYLGEAPFTPGLGENNDAAPRLAIWTGWQIVKEYMDKHPEVTLQQLMTDNDAQKILNESKYRPKEK